MYYFWWVNSTYIVIFVASFFLVFILYVLGFRFLKLSLLLVLCVEIWFSEFRDLIASNLSLVNISTLEPAVNILLVNTLNKYHPFIFYLSVASVFALVLLFSSLLTVQANFVNLKGLNFLPRISKLVLAANFVALFMGSWWAFQEGTWGGWWNWDASEVLGITPSLVLMFIWHKPAYLRHNNHQKWVVQQATFLFIAFYLVTQLNFALISHNFGPKFFFFFNSNLLTSLIFSGVLCWVFFSTQEQQHLGLWGSTSSRMQLTLPHITKNYQPINLMTYIILSCWYLWSISEFIEVTFFHYLSIQILTFLPVIKLNLILLLAMANVFYSSKSLFWLPSVTSPLSLIIGSSKSSMNLPIEVLWHLTLFIFLYINLRITTATIILWSLQLPHNLIHSSEIISWACTPNLSCDGWSINKSTLYLTPEVYASATWSMRDMSNVETTALFNLSISDGLILNCYNLTTALQKPCLLLYTPFLDSVGLLAVLLTSLLFVMKR